jgi:hypothetical protein
MISNFAVRSDGFLVHISLTIGDIETPAGDLQLRVFSSNTNVCEPERTVFGGDASNRVVSLRLNSLTVSNSLVRVEATDPDGGTNGVTIVVPEHTFTVAGPGMDFGFVSAGDYNADGRLDIAVNGHIYRNNAGSLQSITDLGQVVFNHWDDPDSDGRLELFTKPFSGPGYTFDYSDAGGFKQTKPLIGNGGRAPICFGDFDNDGDLDFYSSGIFYRNDQAAQFSVASTFLPGTLGMSGDAVAADFDGDGLLDVLLAESGQVFTNQLVILVNQGNWMFTPRYYDLRCGGYPNAAVADYNNDGLLDVLCTVLDGTNRTTMLLRNKGAFEFEPMPYYFASENSGFISWADYDGDGDMDAMLGGLSPDWPKLMSPMLYRNDGATNFTEVNFGAPPSVAAASFQDNIAWGDFDNDGDLDFVLSTKDASQLFLNAQFRPSPKPSPPTNLVAELTGENSIRLSWTPPGGVRPRLKSCRHLQRSRVECGRKGGIVGSFID